MPPGPLTHLLPFAIPARWSKCLAPPRATPAMLSVISGYPLAASATLRVISLVVALCSSTAVAMVLEMSLIWLMTPLMLPMASTAALGIGLDGFDLVADVFGRFGRLLGEFLDFIGDHGKAFAGFSGARRFDGGIQGQQVGLLRDGGDDLDHLRRSRRWTRPAC